MHQTWNNYTFSMDLDVKHNAYCGETIFWNTKSLKHFFMIMQLHLNKTCTVPWVWNLCCHAFIQYFCIICCTWQIVGANVLRSFLVVVWKRMIAQFQWFLGIAFGDVFKRISLSVTAKFDNCVQIMKWNENFWAQWKDSAQFYIRQQIVQSATKKLLTTYFWCQNGRTEVEP